MISGFAFTVKSVVTLLAPGVFGFYAAQLFQLFGYAVITVASVYYTGENMQPQDAIKGQAFFTMTNTAGSVMASALGGALLDKSGPSLLIMTAILFSAAGAAVMVKGISIKHR